jgi:hypothetical protein
MSAQKSADEKQLFRASPSHAATFSSREFASSVIRVTGRYSPLLQNVPKPVCSSSVHSSVVPVSGLAVQRNTPYAVLGCPHSAESPRERRCSL